jgi:hypothetical protein
MDQAIFVDTHVLYRTKRQPDFVSEKSEVSLHTPALEAEFHPSAIIFLGARWQELPHTKNHGRDGAAFKSNLS